MATNSKEVQAKADKKRAGARARAWWGVIYEESAPKNWRSLIADSLVETLISPYHDKDVLENGEVKKPHWHVLISFKNPCSRKKAAELMKSWGCVIQEHAPKPGEPEQFKVNDFRQAARYLCHLDQPDKHRYEMSEVQSIGSINYQELVMSSTDEDMILDEIEAFIDTYRIVSYRSFCKLVREYHPEWKFVTRRKFSFHIREYIKSNAWDIQHEEWIASVEDWEGAARSADYDTPSQSSKFQEPRIEKLQVDSEKQEDDSVSDRVASHTQPHAECCPECGSLDIKKNGKTTGGTPRFQCKDCGKSFI